jgi:hypothetical protein
MPGGGQLALVAFGDMNKLVNGNPELTPFYRVFRRHTHFSLENIAIPLEGVTEMSMDTPIRLRAKVPRYADLLTDLTFVFDLPPMYSKLYDGRVPAFRWIHMLGAFVIDTVSIYVGGSKIQEFPGEWIAARASVDYPVDKYLKWRAMVGDVPELYAPEWGVHGKSANYPFQKGEYPHAVADPSGNPVAASLPARTLRVPLPFWFSEIWGRALPLVSLQLHEVEVQFTLRTLREVYRIMDREFQAEPVRPGRYIVPDPSRPTQIDPTLPAPPYDNLTLQNAYASTNEPAVETLRNYFTQPGEPPAYQDGWAMNPRLEGTYAYITDAEKRMFVGRELQSLVHQVQVFRFPNVVTRSRLNLDAHGLVTRILFYGRRSDAIESRNDYINLSNWKSMTQAPYFPIPGSTQPNSGLYIPYYGGRDILQSVRLLLAGNEIYQEKPASFFEVQSAFSHAAGGGVAGPGGLKPDDVMGPIYQFPFALNMSDHEQPSGSLNTSLVREIQLEVNPTPLDPASYYVYDMTVFVESMNTVKFINGMAGSGFAI